MPRVGEFVRLLSGKKVLPVDAPAVVTVAGLRSPPDHHADLVPGLLLLLLLLLLLHPRCPHGARPCHEGPSSSPAAGGGDEAAGEAGGGADL